MLKYDRHDITFQEIPGEVCLTFTITNCPNACEGCHSPHLRGDIGEELTERVLKDLLNTYDVSCVLFLGGDSDHKEIARLSKFIKSRHIRTAFYSGNDRFDIRLFDVLDYYKIGSYQEALGGLRERSTNQRLYLLKGSIPNDITEELHVGKKEERAGCPSSQRGADDID